MKTTVNLEVLTPIFIGNEENYYPQEFFIEDDKLFFIDKDRFHKKIMQENLYDEFLERSSNINKLLRFINDYADKTVALQEVDIDSEVANELFKSVSRPVEAFIKDKFYFTPYIPGSTLKGVIRTAILDYKIDKFKNSINNIERLREKEIETVIFCNENRNSRTNRLQFDAKKDILKALFVDDLKPKDYKLRVLKPLNRPYRKNKDNPIPIILECLTEGNFSGEIRVDEYLLNNDSSLRNNKYFKDEPLSIELIQKALKHFFVKIQTIEHKKFRVAIPYYREYLIKIGKHGGAGSKSLNDLRKVYIKQLKKKLDYQLSVWIDKNEDPLGWTKLHFVGENWKSLLHKSL